MLSYAPALGRLWTGALQAETMRVQPGQSLANATEKQVITARAHPAAGLTAVVSRSHLDPETMRFLESLPIVDRQEAGSSLKFCVLAQGDADVYPRFGRTMEWDTAAGHAVLRAAGGTVLTTTGEALTYGKSGYGNPSFIAWGCTP